MGERRALLIGVQNDRFGRLDFVPEVVRDLHAVVLDRRYGACRPALPDGRELLTGPAATRAAMVTALGDAMASAGRDQATLFVYFLGHGHKEDEDFYLVAADTPGPELIDSENGVSLGQRIKELLRRHPGVDGLMLVIDACHSGAVISNPVPGLLRQGLQARVEFFAATRPEEVASRGCFSRSLIELLKKGSPRTADAELRAYDEHDRLREVAPAGCADLAPAIHMSLNGSRDAGLWLGRNGAADLRPALAGTQVAGVVARLTRDWQKRQGPAADIMPVARRRHLTDRHHRWPGHGQVGAARLVRAAQRRGVPAAWTPWSLPGPATTWPTWPGRCWSSSAEARPTARPPDGSRRPRPFSRKRHSPGSIRSSPARSPTSTRTSGSWSGSTPSTSSAPCSGGGCSTPSRTCPALP